MNSRLRVMTGLMVMLALVVLPAGASITYYGAGTGSQSNLSASAEFAITGNTLTITLTNTSSSMVTIPSEILTALFFSTNGVTLTPVSAILGSGSTLLNDTTVGGDVGGEWAYEDDFTTAPGGAPQGVSTAGFGLFGPFDRFPGADLDGQTNIGGWGYGIVPASGVENENPFIGKPFIDNSVVFTFSFGGDLTLDDITDVSFQYGTALYEPNLPGTVVPEPASLSLVGIGIALMAMRQVSKRRNANS